MIRAKKHIIKDIRGVPILDEGRRVPKKSPFLPHVDTSLGETLRILDPLPVPTRNGGRIRIVLYSHDTMGLGHVRRNRLIAQALAESHLNSDILLICGTNVATSFAMPPGVDCLTLPGLGKDLDGKYKSRSLALSLKEIVALRSGIICSAIRGYQPDIFIVDNVPRGTNQELDSTLRYLQSTKSTRLILGLRDILDEPESVQREWKRKNNEAIIRKFYEEVWVYGDRSVFDLVREYGFSNDLELKMRYTGYLDRKGYSARGTRLGRSKTFADLELPPGKLVLCLAGGGQDGTRLVEIFAQAHLPPKTNGVIITGPFMPPKILKDLKSRCILEPRLKVLEFHPEPTQLIRYADHVVSMGGYNTVSEILSFGKRALIVPRVVPRLEQMIRAKHLNSLDLIDFCHPEQLNPEYLTQWLACSNKVYSLAHDRINLKGLEHIPKFIEEVLAR